MQTDKQGLGRLGEDLAADYLEKSGYTVVGRNLHFSKNELDIVAEDDGFIVFVEVKTRSCLYPESNGYGTPGRAVDHKKRGKHTENPVVIFAVPFLKRSVNFLQ